MEVLMYCNKVFKHSWKGISIVIMSNAFESLIGCVAYIITFQNAYNQWCKEDKK